MVVSVFSPCCQCSYLLSGVRCGMHQRSRCSRFLAYIQNLHRARAHRVLIQELKQLIQAK